MVRVLSWAMAMAVALVAAPASWSAGPTHPAPLYALAAEGTWVKYEWTQTAHGRTRKGKLVVRCTGRRLVAGVPHSWVQIERIDGEGREATRQVRKFLLSEKAIQEGTLPAAAHEGYALQGERVQPLTAAQLDLTLRLGFGPRVTLEEEVQEKVKTALGEWACRRVAARGLNGTRNLEYRAWLTPGVPFGCACFELTERTGRESRLVFRAAVVATGVEPPEDAVEEGAVVPPLGATPW
jgi:hypothetical protein